MGLCRLSSAGAVRYPAACRPCLKASVRHLLREAVALEEAIDEVAQAAARLRAAHQVLHRVPGCCCSVSGSLCRAAVMPLSPRARERRSGARRLTTSSLCCSASIYVIGKKQLLWWLLVLCGASKPSKVGGP